MLRNRKKYYEMDPREKFESSARLWYALFYFWGILHYGLGGGAVLVTVIVANRPDLTVYGIPVAVISACLVALTAFLKPAEAAYGYDQAYTFGNYCIMRFQASQDNPAPEIRYTLSDLARDYAVARAMISRIHPFRLSVGTGDRTPVRHPEAD